MKREIVLSTLLGAAAWALSNWAMAWDSGPCPGGDASPCIEVVEHGNTYHINGSGQHAGVWYGLPSTGADFAFSGSNVDMQCAMNFHCTLTLRGKVKKCQDSSGSWRIGAQVNSASVSGSFPCGLVSFGGFPWYSKGTAIANHCPFEDDCDSFIPYTPGATDYIGHFGTIDISALGVGLVNNEHIHDVLFTPGVGARFVFDSDFYDCYENANCYINGVLTLNNATSLDIQ